MRRAGGETIAGADALWRVMGTGGESPSATYFSRNPIGHYWFCEHREPRKEDAVDEMKDRDIEACETCVSSMQKRRRCINRLDG